MTIVVHKANGLGHQGESASVRIRATEEFPANLGSLEETEALMDYEAQQIMAGLRRLPRGTIHRLIGHLLRQYSVGYIGSMDT